MDERRRSKDEIARRNNDPRKHTKGHKKNAISRRFMCLRGFTTAALPNEAQPALAHAHEAPLPNHQMIEHIDIQQLAGRDDLARHQHILGAGCG